MSGIINSAGSKSGIIGMTEDPGPSADGWYCTKSSSQDLSSAAILDFDSIRHMGSNCSESAGTITVSTPGFYFISIGVSNSSYVDDVNEWYFWKDGGYYGHRNYMSNMGESRFPTNNITILVELEAGSTAAWRGVGNIHGDTGNDSMTWHCGFRIGN